VRGPFFPDAVYDKLGIPIAAHVRARKKKTENERTAWGKKREGGTIRKWTSLRVGPGKVRGGGPKFASTNNLNFISEPI